VPRREKVARTELSSVLQTPYADHSRMACNPEVSKRRAVVRQRSSLPHDGNDPLRG
jgi:hypothetical protein